MLSVLAVGLLPNKFTNFYLTYNATQCIPCKVVAIFVLGIAVKPELYRSHLLPLTRHISLLASSSAGVDFQLNRLKWTCGDNSVFIYRNFGLNFLF
jgi:hypothetical protein